MEQQTALSGCREQRPHNQGGPEGDQLPRGRCLAWCIHAMVSRPREYIIIQVVEKTDKVQDDLGVSWLTEGVEEVLEWHQEGIAADEEELRR